MAGRLRKHAPLFRYLGRCNPKTAKSIIKASDRELLDTFCECSLNILNGNVSLTDHQRRRLKPFKNSLRQLTKKKVSRNHKRALLQKGGFLSALLAPLGAILSTVLGTN